VGSTRQSPARTRVGLLYRSGMSPSEAWSGIPAGLGDGLKRMSVDARLIDAEPPALLERGAEIWAYAMRRDRHGGMLSWEVAHLRRLTARLRAGWGCRFDGVIQMGSDFGIPFPSRFVTYEDMTVPQCVRLASLPNTLGDHWIRRWMTLQKSCYEAAIGCCLASSWAADSVVKEYGISPSKVHVVGIGRNHDPRALDRDWSRPRFLFVGQDWERKNGPMLVRVFSQLREHVRGASLDIVGNHPRLDERGVVGHGPLSFTHAVGRAKLNALFEAATCFVMPSKYEPFGMVYVEAGAAGIPSIGTTIGGVRDFIRDDAGLLVDPGDEHALRDAMIRLSEPTRAARMGSIARERSRLFTWTAVAERLVGVLGLRDRSSSTSH
jgi:glycosyltransferase involved in cell wall biosynthesis